MGVSEKTKKEPENFMVGFLINSLSVKVRTENSIGSFW
jgi:hypothetical protein